MRRQNGGKQRVRENIWALFEERGEALFPGARGRIPNFRGAARAAERLAATPEWRAAKAIKCNPDAPQRPVRLRALREGKVIYMAVPRLTTTKCFWKLDPERIAKKDLARAATIRGASTLGRPVWPRELPHIDVVVAGSVAVNRKGARVGKGGGYSDLEYAIGREVGAIDERTVISTTVHPLQLGDGELPVTAHDFFLDLIATPDETVRLRHGRQPAGILWKQLSAGQLDAIPVLRSFRR